MFRINDNLILFFLSFLFLYHITCFLPFYRFAPSLKTISYVGDKESREILRNQIREEWDETSVILTTYEVNTVRRTTRYRYYEVSGCQMLVFLPTTYEVRGKVMFLLECVCDSVRRGGGGGKRVGPPWTVNYLLTGRSLPPAQELVIAPPPPPPASNCWPGMISQSK